jgi:hypothetical protein
MPDDTALRATVTQDIRAADEALIIEDVVTFVNLAGLAPILTVRTTLGLNSLLIHTAGHVDIV